MRRKLLIGGIVGVTLAVLITAIFFPVIGESSNQSGAIAPGVSIVHVTGGVVTLHLPPAGGNLTGRPTELQISGSYVSSGEGVFFGPGVSISVSLWIPELNAYIPVATIGDNNDPGFVNWSQQVGRGTPVAQNFIIVNSSQATVTTTSDILTVNLTVPVNIKFGDPLPAFYKALNFTLPPFSLDFHATGEAFPTGSGMVVPTSGYTIRSSAIQEPAWVRAWIPAWLGPSPIAFDGAINVESNVTYTPPQ